MGNDESDDKNLALWNRETVQTDKYNTTDIIDSDYTVHLNTRCVHCTLMGTYNGS